MWLIDRKGKLFVGVHCPHGVWVDGIIRGGYNGRKAELVCILVGLKVEGEGVFDDHVGLSN